MPIKMCVHVLTHKVFICQFNLSMHSKDGGWHYDDIYYYYNIQYNLWLKMYSEEMK